MTDGWDERTEAIPGTKGDKSFELDVDFGLDIKPVDATENLTRPSIVVFEPSPLGLAAALTAFGYAVRTGTTGVDVMSLVAAQPPTVVVCAPAPDPERRRLLAAALRLRFPAIPVLYVSTHAGQEEAVLGAIREGARAVIAWPLPSPADLARVLGPYVKLSAERAGVDDDSDAIVTPKRPLTKNGIGRPAVDDEPITAPQVPAYSSDELHDAGTALMPPSSSPLLMDTGLHAPSLASASAEEIVDDGPTEMTEVVTPPKSTKASPPRPTTLPPDALRPMPVALPAPNPFASKPPTSPVAPSPPMPSPPTSNPFAKPTRPPSKPAERAASFREEEPTTQPGVRPVPVAVEEAQSEKRGEIGALLAAVSPFLWSLEDAARWADTLAEAGDPAARNHARALHLLAKILAQLQARIDESGA